MCPNMADPKYSRVSKSLNKYLKNKWKMDYCPDTETSHSCMLVFAWICHCVVCSVWIVCAVCTVCTVCTVCVVCTVCTVCTYVDM